MNTGNSRKTISIESIGIRNASLSFGCVSLGFVYHLSMSLTNAQNFPQRFKFIISEDLTGDKSINNEISNVDSIYLTSGVDQRGDEVSVKPNNAIRVISITNLIAPGMKTDFIIELTAAVERYSKYTLKILQSDTPDILEYSVRAFVVPPDVYRSFRRTNQVYGKSMAVDGVSVVRNIGAFDDNRSVLSSASSINSYAFVDEEDIEELMDYPILSTTYWDPVAKELKIDNKLTQVYIDPGTSVEGCLQRTRELRKERYRELEDMGYYTSRLLEDFRASQPNTKQKQKL